jgi:transposase-like protein
VGDLTLAIPRLRQRSFFPSWLEPATEWTRPSTPW